MDRLSEQQIRLLEGLAVLRDRGILTEQEFTEQADRILGRHVLSSAELDSEDNLGVPGTDEASGPFTHPDAGFVEDENEDPEEASHVSVASHDELDNCSGHVSQDSEATEKSKMGDSWIETSTSANQSRPLVVRFRNHRMTFAMVVLFALATVVTVVVNLSTGESQEITLNSPLPSATILVPQQEFPNSNTTEPPTTSTLVAPTKSTATTTAIEALQCPYERIISAENNTIKSPEGVKITILPTVYESVRTADGYTIDVSEYVPGKFGDFEAVNPTNYRIRIGLQAKVTWDGGSYSYSWEPDNGRGWVNGYQSRAIRSFNFPTLSSEPLTNFEISMDSATISFVCP